MTVEIKKEDKQLTVVVSGRFDSNLASEADFKMEEAGLTEGCDFGVTIDLSGVDYIASGGLRVLISTRKCFRR